MDDIVIAMYAKGISLHDIKEMIKKVYNIDLSEQTLSELTSAVSEKAKRARHGGWTNLCLFTGRPETQGRGGF